MIDVFFNETATTEIYTLSLHDALPIWSRRRRGRSRAARPAGRPGGRASPRAAASGARSPAPRAARSEEHTSELQSRQYLVCRLLLEKKNLIYSTLSYEYTAQLQRDPYL